jgi:hypothetical protein
VAVASFSRSWSQDPSRTPVEAHHAPHRCAGQRVLRFDPSAIDPASPRHRRGSGMRLTCAYLQGMLAKGGGPGPVHRQFVSAAQSRFSGELSSNRRCIPLGQTGELRLRARPGALLSVA